MTNQQEEAATIKSRKVAINLSDNDCIRISKLCGVHNISIETLLENFIGDLVAGTYSNGSDERMYAKLYFNRTWMSWYNDNVTLISYLIDKWLLEEFISHTELLQSLEYDYKCFTEHPDECDDNDIKDIQEEIIDCKADIQDIINDFLEVCENPDISISDEIEKAKRWYANYRKFCDDGVSTRLDLVV